MILGVDHVALSCSDVARAAERLVQEGFSVRYLARDVRNDPSKREFLAEYRPLHDTAICAGEGGPTIELTQHSAPLDARETSPYQVLLAGVPGRREPPGCRELESLAPTWRDAAGVTRPEPVLWSDLEAQAWVDRAGEGAIRVRKVMLLTGNLEISAGFWTSGLGFTLEGQADDWRSLRLRSPIPAWELELLLARAPEACRVERPLLDQAGFTCLGLLTTRVDADLAKACAHGGRSSGAPFELEIGGKRLRLVLVRGPDNEAIELVQVLQS